MSTTTAASIALLTPIVASNAVFSARRASRGIDALQDNPFYAAANMDIAAAQVVKGSKAATSIVSATDPALNAVTKSAAETIKSVSKTNKILSGASKVVNFTADHINPVICVGSTFKVLGSDDKVNEAAAETIRLGSMFGSEGVTKWFIGMPYTKKIDGKTFTFKRNGKYKALIGEKQVENIKKYCNNKTLLKYAPSTAKGLCFVGASILGYKFGDLVAKSILDLDDKTTDNVSAAA